MPAHYAPPPDSPSNSSKTFPSQTVTFSPTPRRHNSFRCNTYGLPRKWCKQKTYGGAKSFKCNTYKKHGGGAPFSTFRRSALQIRRLCLLCIPVGSAGYPGRICGTFRYDFRALKPCFISFATFPNFLTCKPSDLSTFLCPLPTVCPPAADMLVSLLQI